MKFLTLSEKQLPTEYLKIREPHLLISITNPNHEVPIPNLQYCKGTLRLQFEDVEDISDKSVYFDMGMAKDILDFVNTMISSVNLIVVHCGAGISRSVAVASALSKIINNIDDVIFSNGVPNMLVYTTILESYFGERKLAEKWKRIHYLRSKSLKNTLNPVLQKIVEYKLNKREKGD